LEILGNMMRILVTGGAGFIGNHLVKRLINEGFYVVVFDNLHSAKLNSKGNLINKTSKFIQGDLRDYDLVRASVKNIDAIYHLGAQSNVLGSQQDIDYCISTNVNGTYNILKAASEENISRIIFTSSREVYGDVQQFPVKEDAPLLAKNAYGLSKVVGELYCQLFADTYDLKVITLRLSNVYGSGDKGRVIPIFIEKASCGKPLEIFGGTQIIDFVWIDLVVEALIRSLSYPIIGEKVNIGSGVGTSIKELAKMICDLTQSSSSILVQPSNEIETQKYTADITKMKSLLKIEPYTSLCEGIHTMIEDENIL
jgi:UDP-glucose 4-epimerase